MDRQIAMEGSPDGKTLTTKAKATHANGDAFESTAVIDRVL